MIPTTGRGSLEAARSSAVAADEIIVIQDNTGDRGYTARSLGMAQATGTHIAFLDDDDTYTPEAIDLFREHAADRPVIFRMDDPFHGVLWREPLVSYGNVGTPMFLVPNDPARLGTWEGIEFGRGAPRGGDFHFLEGCIDRMGNPVWREEIVAIIRPHERTTVSVVTPWRNHPEFLPDFEQAMAWGKPEELIVVDNGSDPPIDLPGFRLERNAGFCAANNLGLEAATSEAVLFLNNDVVTTSVDWLQRIRAALEPGVLVGANIRLDPHGAVDGQPLPYIDGWCVAGMREDLLELGGWDESLTEPAYYSDNDLSLRARAAGMSLREVRTGIRHKLNGSTSPDAELTVRATVANRERFTELARTLTA